MARPNRRNLISCPMTLKSIRRREPRICRTKMTCLCSFSRSSNSCRRHSQICAAQTTTTRPLQTQLKMAVPSETQKAQMYLQVPPRKQYSLPWQTSSSNSLGAPLTLAARMAMILVKAPKTMPTRATPAKCQINKRTPMVASMAPPSNSNRNNRWASSNPLAEIRKTPR
mgnify:CR=1 FL=1